MVIDKELIMEESVTVPRQNGGRYAEDINV
jgi:hypothetical protein